MYRCGDAHHASASASVLSCIPHRLRIAQFSMRCGPAYGLLACLALTGLAEVTSDISPARGELRQIVASADDISAVAGALKSEERAVLYFDASSDRCAPLHLHITSQRNGVLGVVHAFALTCARVITDMHTLTNGLQRPCYTITAKCSLDRQLKTALSPCCGLLGQPRAEATSCPR